MRRSLLSISLMLFSMLAFSQASGDPNLDMSPNAFQNQGGIAKANWNLQFQHALNRSATAGIEADSAHFFVTVWSSNKNYKYTLAGTLVDSFSITGSPFPSSGTSFLRDIAWDGTYFYGSNATATIYKMDFTTKTCVGSIACPAGTVVRFCAYDPTADNGQGGFWVGNWSDGAKLISRNGTQLDAIPSTAVTGLSSYGAAYDTTTANGGPFLWLYSQTGNGNELVQISITTKQKTGLIYDITKDVTVPTGSIAGGAFIAKNIVTGTTTLGGLIQGQKLFGYDLTSTVPYANDVALAKLDVTKYVLANQPLQIKGVIENQGLSTTSSVNINWQINGGAVNTQNVTGLSLGFFQTSNFTHSATWTPPATGLYNLKVWIDSPNGQPDLFTLNDTISMDVSVVTGFVQRMPLHESFTSSTCVPCVNGNINVKNIFNANPNKWVCVKYQMSWPSPGDPYYTIEGNDRRTYYSINSVPALVVEANAPINSASYTSTMLNEYYSQPAIISINADFAQPGNGKTVNLNVSLNSTGVIPSTNLKLYAAIFEYQTTDNVGGNGETSFDFVMKKFMPNTTGTAIDPMAINTPVSKTLTYTFNGNYRLPPNASSPINHATEHSVEEFSDLGVVVWLQDAVTKEIFQSTYATKTASIDEPNDGTGIIALFPNPASDNAWMKYQIARNETVKVEVYDVLGQKVLSHDEGMQQAGTYDISIPTSELSAGTYLVKLHVGDRVISQKLIRQ